MRNLHRPPTDSHRSPPAAAPRIRVGNPRAGRPRVSTALLCACLAAPLLAGCLVSSSNSTTESGVRVSNATLAQVEPGKTTESWVLATLGEPTSRVDVPGQPGTQILRYDYSRSEESAGAVFLIFGGATRRQTSSRAFFEVTNGVVTRYWQEV